MQPKKILYATVSWIEGSRINWNCFHWSRRQWQICCVSVCECRNLTSHCTLLPIKPRGEREGEREREIRKYRRHQAIWSITGHVPLRERETLCCFNGCSLTVTHAECVTHNITESFLYIDFIWSLFTSSLMVKHASKHSKRVMWIPRTHTHTHTHTHTLYIYQVDSIG